MIKNKAELVLHPIRLRIVTAVAGRQLTSKQVAALLPDVPQATLYRHLSKLTEGDILEVVSEKLVHGILERTYALPKEAAKFSREDFERMTPEEHRKYFAVFLGELNQQLDRYVSQSRFSPTEDGMTYFYYTAPFSQKEARQFREDLLEFCQSRAFPPEGRSRYKLSVAFIPSLELSEENL